jgi:AraC-like DNA-binding protein
VSSLDRLIDGLNVGVEPFAICEVRRDGNVVLEEHVNTALHYVLAGEGTAWHMTGRSYSLTPHTIIIAPPGSCLIVTCGQQPSMSFAKPDCTDLPGGWHKAIVGEVGSGLTMACGAVRASHLGVTGIFDRLRIPLFDSVVDDETFREPFVRLLKELAAPGPGTKALAESLMKQCLISLLRRHSIPGAEAPWLAAIGKPALGRAISVMLDKPEAPHSLDSLAHVAGMSRSTFAKQFKESFDRTAIEFLKEVRLRRAAQLLRNTDLPVKTIAWRVGFESRSHFSRAFKAFTSKDPAAYRNDSKAQ